MILNRYYGLSGNPFQGSSAAPALYLSPTHREALAALQWGLQEPSGFTLLTGEPGAGKTTLICTLLAEFHPQTRVIHLANPRLSFREMLASILAELKIRKRLSRLAMQEALNDFLASLPPGHRLALIIDEAQGLSDETLDELRLLCNLPAAAGNALQLLLVGQPELAERLGTPALRQLNERIGARAQLRRLRRTEIYEYIDCRLRSVGGHADAIFSHGALRRIAVHSYGLPRRINVLCHNAMLLAYVANSRHVESRMVASAVRDYDGGHNRRKAAPAASRRRRRQAIPVAAALLLGLAVWEWAPQAYDLGHAYLSDKALKTAPDTVGLLAPALPIVADAPQAAANAPASGLKAVPPAPRTFAAPAAAMQPPVAGGKPAIAGNRNHRIPGSAGRDGSNAGRPSGAPRLRVTIHSGDTVADLATRYLGSSTGDTLARVAHANPQIRDINEVYPGETVLLPGGAGERTR